MFRNIEITLSDAISYIKTRMLIYYFLGIWSKFIDAEKKYTASFGGI